MMLLFKFHPNNITPTEDNLGEMFPILSTVMQCYECIGHGFGKQIGMLNHCLTLLDNFVISSLNLAKCALLGK